MIYCVFYTDRFIPRRFAGYVYGPVILIRTKYRGDTGLLEHEKTHVRQWWRGLGIFYYLRYRFSLKWRLRYEVEGYSVQLKYSPEDLLIFAELLATLYGLDLTREEALKLLIKEAG